ncbi:MAG: trigger factor family protein [Anaerotruncus sp.]|nr:trigger factor family protein [Anaerotruncus sp.]
MDRIFREVRREIQKDITVPGFRKGKIPSSILRSRSSGT